MAARLTFTGFSFPPRATTAGLFRFVISTTTAAVRVTKSHSDKSLKKNPFLTQLSIPIYYCTICKISLQFLTCERVPWFACTWVGGGARVGRQGPVEPRGGRGAARGHLLGFPPKLLQQRRRRIQDGGGASSYCVLCSIASQPGPVRSILHCSRTGCPPTQQQYSIKTQRNINISKNAHYKISLVNNINI